MTRTVKSAAAARVTPVTSLPGLALRLALHWWRQLAALAAACGIVAATISGALGVGAAVEAGLERLARARLGGIDAAVVGEEFFRSDLAAELARRMADEQVAALLPGIVIEAAVETVADTKSDSRSVRAVVLACADPAALGFQGGTPTLVGDSVALNPALATALGVDAGSAVVLRVAERSAAPADVPLGRRDVRSAGRRVAVAEVLPPSGIGQFSLEPTQVTRPLVLAPLATVQRLLGRGDVANIVFAVSGSDAATRTAAARLGTASTLRGSLVPALEDYGLVLDEVPSTPRAVRLTSSRLILPPEIDRAAEAVLAPRGGRPSLVFLATAIATTGRPSAASVPYSTVLGVDATTLPVGDLVDASGAPLAPPGPDGIVIDRWLADDLAAQGNPVAPDDALEIAYFLPETVHGRVEEARATLRVAGIAEMRGAAVDRTLVPDVEGVSDEASIADWDPPFPFDSARVRTTPPHDEDDRYWREYGTTPKAFVSLATARRIAGSRFGRSTAWHVPAVAVDDLPGLRRTLAEAIRPEAAGLRVVPLAAEARAAARGSTPFGPLFLALSSFVVLAGMLLEWLLFRLLVAARRREIGILSAVGWPPRRLALLLTLLGLGAAVVGCGAGACLGPAWAATLLDALGRAWARAVAGGDVQVFGTAVNAARSIPVAMLASVLVSLGTLGWAAARTARVEPLRLVRDAAEPPAHGGRNMRSWIVGVTAVVAVVAGGVGLGAAPERAVASFFFAGGLALVSLVTVAYGWIVTPLARLVTSLASIALRSVAANRSRALAVITIVAIAEFLIVALSAFELRPPPAPADIRSPTGGWTMLASFGTPVSAESAADLAGGDIALVRSSGGTDASCTNLYAATRPAVLGVGPGFIARGGFSFVAHAPLAADPGNPWTLLERPANAGGPIPAILDQATAQWALKVGGIGSRFTVPDDDDVAVEFEIVGLLAPGILQGFVLVGERSFETVFPRRSGYTLALLGAAAGESPAELEARAGRAWADAGVLFEPAIGRLARISAVQNTFLAGFQTLGLLGLLLGTAGVAAVQAQGVLERIGQFGLLAAIGFSAARVRRLVIAESILLVGLGLLAGCLAGLVALMPAFLDGRAALPTGWIAVTCGLTLAAAAAAGTIAAGQATRVNPRDALRSA